MTTHGFSLIEIIMVMAIIALIASSGLFFSFNDFHVAVVRSERDRVVALLSLARARAMANIGASPHGFCIESDAYVVFEGEGCFDLNAVKERTPLHAGMSVASLLPEGVTFEALSGRPNWSGSFSIEFDSRIVSISITPLGLIDW